MWFGRKKASAVLEAPVPPVRLTPRAVKVGGDAEEITAYANLCQRIRAETPAVQMLRLQHFLAEQGILAYDSIEVRQHLSKLCGETKRYNWHPLREEDGGVSFRWYWGDERCASSSSPSIHLYGEVVPSSVLETVEKIVEKFPDAKFFVSAISDVKDPFLGVTFPGQVLIIVEVWDEPGFRPVRAG